MIYLIGGAPRTGKSILAQQLAADLKAGWISTDLLIEVLKAKQVEGMQATWDATPAAITAEAAWFFPCLERFVWGVGGMAENYVIEGVHFLPAQVAELSSRYQVRSVFLGCSAMTLERFDNFPGHSPGYAFLPEEMRRQMANDIPHWSELISHEAARFNLPYIDTSDDFPTRLTRATAHLIGTP
jgi:chloramphenicol 3-O-phosphotransferase